MSGNAWSMVATEPPIDDSGNQAKGKRDIAEECRTEQGNRGSGSAREYQMPARDQPRAVLLTSRQVAAPAPTHYLGVPLDASASVVRQRLKGLPTPTVSGTCKTTVPVNPMSASWRS